MNHFEARQDKVSRRWHYTCRNGLEIWAVGNCGSDGGHDSEAAANACYRKSLIDGARLTKLVDDARECGACGKPADRVTAVLNRVYALCKEHGNARGLDQLVPAVGAIISE